MSSFEVRNEQIEGALKDVGRAIAASLPEDWGFALLIFSFGEGGAAPSTSPMRNGGTC